MGEIRWLIFPKELYLSRVVHEHSMVNVLRLKQGYPDKVVLTRYEQVVSNPRKTLLSLCKSIGVCFSEQLMNFGQYETISKGVPIYTNGKYDPIEDMVKYKGYSTASVGRWKSSEHKKRIKECREQQGFLDIMQRLGYQI